MTWEDMKPVIEQIEKTPIVTFVDIYPNAKENKDLSNMENYLYHGIRFDNGLKKFENILKTKMICCGKKSPYYFSYADNCNEGEYVSLMECRDRTKSMFRTFITRTVSLVLHPDIDAIKTNYLSFNEWDAIADRTKELKHRYSYAKGEYQVKGCIPFEAVVAIGIPKRSMIQDGGEKYVETLLPMVKELLAMYEINLPIVDPTDHNKVLVPSEKYDVDASLFQEAFSHFTESYCDNLRENRVASSYKVYKKKDRFIDNYKNQVFSMKKNK